MGQQSARAGFRRRDLEVESTQLGYDPLLEVFPILRDEVASDRAMDFRLDLVQNFAGTDEPEVHLVRAGAISDLEIAAFFQAEPDRFLDRAFAQAHDPVNSAFARGQIAAEFPEQRQHRFSEHRLEFARGTWKQENMR